MGAFLATPVGSWVRVFVSGVLGAWLLDLSGAATIDWENWQGWVIAGLVSALPVVIAYLNSADPRFGKTQ
jgi:hypothetical protein